MRGLALMSLLTAMFVIFDVVAFDGEHVGPAWEQLKQEGHHFDRSATTVVKRIIPNR